MKIIRGCPLFLFASVSLLLAEVKLVPVGMPKAGGDIGAGYAEVMSALPAAAQNAARVVVYEGLPHPSEGRSVVQDEIKSQPTVLIDGNWFYTPPQPLQEGDFAAFKYGLGVPWFTPWAGVKFCGGFHADYAVAFESDGRSYLVMFCFGCHEARIYRLPGDKTNSSDLANFRLTVDMTPKGYAEVRELFTKYRKLRPAAPIQPKQTTPPAPPRVPVPPSPGS